jgi:cytochrome P450
MQCYTTQRDPSVYEDAESFKPERWLDPSNVTQNMKELFMPFSKGTRACLGKNLAMIELKLIVAHLVRQFQWIAAPSTTDATMDTKDYFLLLPVGGKCELVFTPAVSC